MMSQQQDLYLSGMLWSSGLPCCQQLKINLGIFLKKKNVAIHMQLLFSLTVCLKSICFLKPRQFAHNEAPLWALCKARSFTHLPDKEGVGGREEKTSLPHSNLIHSKTFRFTVLSSGHPNYLPLPLQTSSVNFNQLECNQGLK